jgi:hypothetical protein
VRGVGSPVSAPVQAALNLGPQAATAWNGIQTQMQNEGWGAQQIDNAANSFVQTYNQLNQGNIIGSGTDPVSAAAGLVSVGNTIAGAASTVAGLATAVASGSVPKELNAVMGLVAAAVPAAVAAGAISFGVGAAIVIGAEIVTSALTDLLGSSPQPEGNVGGCAYYGTSGPPTIVDNYVWSWPAGGVVSAGPGNAAWRRFPSLTTVQDTIWFLPYTLSLYPPAPAPVTQTWQWTAGQNNATDQWYACYTMPTDAGKRPIDQLSYSNGASVYHHLECEAALASAVPKDGSPAAALAAFQLAFFAAWKANAEYGLNGLQQRPDWEVLQQTLILWNNAHSSSQTVNIPSAPTSALVGDGSSSCPSTITPYASILLGQSFAKMGGSFLRPGGIAVLNAGPVKSQVDGTENISALIAGAMATHNGSEKPASASKNIAIGSAVAVGAGLLGAFLYARHKRTTTKAVLKTAWQKTGGRVHVPKLPKLGKGR